MTPKNTADPEENPLGVLDDAASVDTAGIGILGGTAQVSVSLPTEEDDDLADDGVVDGEVVGDLIIDESSVAALPRIDPPSTVKPAAPSATPPLRSSRVCRPAAIAAQTTPHSLSAQWFSGSMVAIRGQSRRGARATVGYR